MEAKLSPLLMGLFAAIALLLVSAGIYGVMSNAVTQRTSEMGVRIALGAQPREVRCIVIAGGLQLAVCGVAIGLLIVPGLARVLASYLYGFDTADVSRIAIARQIEPSSGLLYRISATDPLTLVAVSLTLIAFALSASYLPARRATRVDLLLALRSE